MIYGDIERKKQFTKRKQQYTDYVNEHIRNVHNMYHFYMPVWMDYFGNGPIFGELDRIIEDHDKSKFSDEEFGPYMRRFFPENPVEKGTKLPATPDFNKAWLHHIQNNAHHPEHWCLYEEKDGEIIKTVFDMPETEIIALLCDWAAMSIYCHDTIWNYWEGAGKTKVLSDNTSKLIDYFVYKMKDYSETHEYNPADY